MGQEGTYKKGGEESIISTNAIFPERELLSKIKLINFLLFINR